jgi:hypothetical protein
MKRPKARFMTRSAGGDCFDMLLDVLEIGECKVLFAGNRVTARLKGWERSKLLRGSYEQ